MTDFTATDSNEGDSDVRHKSSPADGFNHSGNARTGLLLMAVLTLTGFLAFASSALGAPPVVTIDPPAHSGFSAHLTGTVDPADTETYYFFQYSTDPETEGWTNGPHAYNSPLAPNSGPTAVSEDLSGLEPATEYQVRLGAENFVDPAVYSAEPNPTFTTAAEAPYATTTGATVAAGGTSAMVGGRVNPRNLATTYWIEYGTSAGYGQNVPASKGANAGSGGQTIAVSQGLNGLTPETTYHFRIVAENTTGKTAGQDLTFKTPAAAAPPPLSCPNQALRVGPSAALPSCRAYELVSPQDKNESNANAGPFTADGEHMQFGATGAFAGAPRGGLNSYVGTRTEDGWQAKSVTPALPLSVPQSPIPPSIQLNPDGSRALIQTPDGLVPEDTNYYNDFYLRGSDGSLDWISKPTATFPSGPFDAFFPGGNTADFSHVVFMDVKKRVPAAAGLGEYSYGLYDATNGPLGLVNVDSHGELLSPYGAGLGSGIAGQYEHAISANGERIFFTTPTYISTEESVNPLPPAAKIKRLYLSEAGQITEISASQCTEVACEGPERDAIYQGASVDGSVAFFSSEAQLTNDATPSGGLYRYEVSTGELTLLTPDTTDPEGPGVEGVVGNSDDGSLVYFVATGKLADGATVGLDNLYLFDATTDTTRFIATLDPSDSGIWAAAANSSHPVEVTPSGRNLVFRTAAPLAAGYDNAGHYEIYRYDAAAAELSCVSCLPADTPAQADATFTESNNSLSNVISADGSYVFFQTTAALLPQDKNGKLDVYQWHDGTVSLISSGISSGPSEFSAATPSGRDVAFSTWEPLVSEDDDEHMDAYDARIDGGFPQSSTPPPTSCSGEGCRGGGTGPGAGTAPGTANYAGGDGHPSGPTAAFGVGAISKGQARKWAKTGLLSLRVKVPAAGRVKATARARLGKKTAGVASAATAARKAGTVALALRLSKSARSYLDRHGRLPVTITVTYSKSKAAKRLQVTLVAQHSKQAHRGQR